MQCLLTGFYSNRVVPKFKQKVGREVGTLMLSIIIIERKFVKGGGGGGGVQKHPLPL